MLESPYKEFFGVALTQIALSWQIYPGRSFTIGDFQKIQDFLFSHEDFIESCLETRKFLFTAQDFDKMMNVVNLPEQERLEKFSEIVSEALANHLPDARTNPGREREDMGLDF